MALQEMSDRVLGAPLSRRRFVTLTAAQVTGALVGGAALVDGAQRVTEDETQAQQVIDALPPLPYPPERIQAAREVDRFFNQFSDFSRDRDQVPLTDENRNTILGAASSERIVFEREIVALADQRIEKIADIRSEHDRIYPTLEMLGGATTAAISATILLFEGFNGINRIRHSDGNVPKSPSSLPETL